MHPLGPFARSAAKHCRWPHGEEEGCWRIRFTDVKKAHLDEARDRGHTYRALTGDDSKEGHCSKWEKRLYGATGVRCAPASFHKEFVVFRFCFFVRGGLNAAPSFGLRGDSAIDEISLHRRR